MSVPESKRAKSSFDVLNEARDAAAYTIKILSNDKVFDRKFQSIIDQIGNHAVSIYVFVFQANGIYVASEDDLAERCKLQRKAITYINGMLALIGMCRPLFHIETKRAVYWSDQYVSLRNRIHGWIDSDRRRFDGM